MKTIKAIKQLSMQQAQAIGGVVFLEWCDVTLGPKIKHTARGIQIVYASQRTKDFLTNARN